jgi:hypothetical protein
MNRRLGCHLISGPVCRWQACWPLWYLLTTFPSANEVEGWRFRFPIAVVLEGCWRLHAGDNCRGSMSPMAGISATTCKQDSGAAPAPAARFVRCVSASCGRRTLETITCASRLAPALLRASSEGCAQTVRIVLAPAPSSQRYFGRVCFSSSSVAGVYSSVPDDLLADAHHALELPLLLFAQLVLDTSARQVRIDGWKLTCSKASGTRATPRARSRVPAAACSVPRGTGRTPCA